MRGLAPETRRLRRRMVASQLAGRGIRNCRVLAAMASVPREWFLPPHLAAEAYDDAPLPIGSGQTISQPLIVGLMTEALAPRRSRVHHRAPARPAGRGGGALPPPRSDEHRDPTR